MSHQVTVEKQWTGIEIIRTDMSRYGNSSKACSSHETDLYITYIYNIYRYIYIYITYIDIYIYSLYIAYQCWELWWTICGSMAARQHLVGGRGPVLLGALPTSPSRHQIRDLAAPPFGLLSSMMNEEYMLVHILHIYILYIVIGTRTFPFLSQELQALILGLVPRPKFENISCKQLWKSSW